MGTSTPIKPERLEQRIRSLLLSYRMDEPTRRRQVAGLRARAEWLRTVQSRGPKRPPKQ